MKNIVYFFFRIFLFVLSLSLLAGWGVEVNAQGSLSQIRSATSNGAKWSSAGGFTHFGMAGQSAVSSRIGDGDFAGSVGFLFSTLEKAPTNEPPVALGNAVEFYHEINDLIELKGFDPEGAPIDFHLVKNPQHTAVDQQGIDGQLVRLIPNSDLLTDVVYSDSFQFIVKEKDTELVSDTATISYQFRLEDTRHYVLSFDKDQSDFTVSLIDTLKNPSYTLDINYYDLTDISNAVFVPFEQSVVPKDGFAISGDTLSYTFNVDETVHSYLFNTEQVFITVLATSDNGFSDFGSYILDNSGGKSVILPSDDGQFFVIGSNLSVPENRSVDLQMIAVEFASFDMSSATLEVITNGTKGALSNVSKIDEQENLITWEATYTATEEIGGIDEIEFRVFHPGRNLYDTALLNINIVDINDPPSIDDLLDQQMSEDDVLTIDVIYSDPDNELNISVNSDEASNVNVSEVNGVITIQPVENFFGSTTITVTAEESNTSDSFIVTESFELDILSANDAPTVAVISDQQIDEDNTFSIVLSATDPDGGVQLFDYTAFSNNPSIANVEILDNVMKIVPVENANGSVTISVNADDRTGTLTSLSETENFSIDILAINDAPVVIQNLESQVLVQDFPDYDIELGDYFNDIETASAGLNFNVTNNTNVLVSISGSIATISLTAGFSGVENLTFTASDGIESVDMLVTFVINEQNADLVVSNVISDIALDEDFNSYVLDISQVFSDVNNASAVFTYDLMGNSNVTFVLDAVAQTITFQSPSDFNGSESLFLVGTSNGSSSFTSFNLTVDPVNDAPVINQISDQFIFEDGSFSGLLVDASDVDNTHAELTLTAVSSDQVILKDSDITISSSNSFFYLSANPLANQNGIVNITATISDGELSNEISFALNISSVNDLPNVLVESISDAIEDSNYTLSLTGLFSDPDGDLLSFEIVGKPNWLTINGTDLSGIPSNSDVGVYNMQVSAQDQFGGEVKSSYSFEVSNVNDAPVLLNELPDVVVLQENSFSYVFPESAFEDVDAEDVLTYSVEKFPSWATLTGNNLSGIPQYEDVGVYEIVFKVTDALATFVSDTITLTVEFTVYDAVISVDNAAICFGETAELSVSGAVDYVWYGTEGNVLQTGGASYSTDPSTSIDIFVEGTDGKGNTTPERTTVQITVNELPNAVVSQNEDELMVEATPNATYIWFLDGNPISDTNASTYKPQQSGTYFVEVVSEFGCMAQSDTITFAITGIEIIGFTLEVYPNPTHDCLNISGINHSNELELEVLDVNGRSMDLRVNLTNDRAVINTRALITGFYVLLIKSEDSMESYRFIKQ